MVSLMRSETRAWIFVTFFESHPNGGGSWMVIQMIFWIEELGVMMGPEESLNRKSSKKRW